MFLRQLMALPKGQSFLLSLSKSSIFFVGETVIKIKIALTWPKVIQTSQVRGMLEFSRPHNNKTVQSLALKMAIEILRMMHPILSNV